MPINEVIKRFWNWLKSLFRRRVAPQPHVPTEIEKKLADRILKRQVKEGRLVTTRQPGPNMPKSQPCPQGHGWKRRKQKTMGGANYHCNTCRQDFFVRAK